MPSPFRLRWGPRVAGPCGATPLVTVNVPASSLYGVFSVGAKERFGTLALDGATALPSRSRRWPRPADQLHLP